VMDWLRRHNDPDALAILAVNPGVLAARDDFAFAGFKGGSEPGVLNGSWLVRDRGGTWHAVAASWNNDEALLDQARFIGLMARVLAVLRAR